MKRASTHPALPISLAVMFLFVADLRADPARRHTPVQSVTQVATTPRERARPADERALFAVFAASTGLEARFEEEKHLGLLAVPIRSSGTMYFLPPDRLARIVDQPEASRVLITQTELRTVARGKEKRVDLAQAPELRAFVTSLSQVLAGRREGLAGLWTISYVPVADSPRAWTLTLVPRADVEGHEALTRMVTSLKIQGEGEAVDRIEVVEPNGDRTITRIVEANPLRSFTDEERAAWFGLPPLGQSAGESSR